MKKQRRWEIRDKKVSLLFVGYKAKGKVRSNYPSYISALYLTTEQQEDFIKWYRETLEPQINKKFEEYEEL